MRMRVRIRQIRCKKPSTLAFLPVKNYFVISSLFFSVMALGMEVFAACKCVFGSEFGKSDVRRPIKLAFLPVKIFL
jgi:hypothetical protein